MTRHGPDGMHAVAALLQGRAGRARAPCARTPGRSRSRSREIGHRTVGAQCCRKQWIAIEAAPRQEFPAICWVKYPLARGSAGTVLINWASAVPQGAAEDACDERFGLGVSYSHADNLDRLSASMHDLRRGGREPVAHQDDQHLDREAVCQQDRFGAAV
jgi:hypothetical protein